MEAVNAGCLVATIKEKYYGNADFICRYIDDYNVIRKEGQQDTAEIVANPFNAYHLLKRTTIDWEDVINSIKNHTKAEGK